MTDLCRQDGALPASALHMLRQRNAADLQALAAVRSAAERLCVQPDENGLPADPALRKVYLSLMESCFGLQYRVLCSQEMLCYARGVRQPSEAVDLCRTLRHFVNSAEELTDGYFTVGTCEVPTGLYALIQPERLVFVLLYLLEAAWRAQPEANVMDFTVSSVQTDFRIEMVLRSDPAVSSSPRRMPEEPESGLLFPDSPELLAERFCESFQAKLIRRSAAGAQICTVTFPAAAVCNPLVRISSDSTGYPDDMIYLTMLSRIVPAETVLIGYSFY